MIRDRLKELGVSHLRDGTLPAHYSTGATVAARYRGTKVGLNLLTGLEQAPSGPGGSGEGPSTRLGWIKSENLTPQVIGLQGSNESWNDATVIRNVQCELWATETGYWNAATATSVSRSVYVPRAALEHFRRGIERTQLYELIDTGDQNDGRAYGCSGAMAAASPRSPRWRTPSRF